MLVDLNADDMRVLTLDNYVEYVRGIIDEFKGEDITLVCHSFGGRIALKDAGNTAVKRLVLTDIAGLKPRRGIKYFYRRLRYRMNKLLGKDTSKCGSPDYQALSPVMKRTFNNIINEHLDSYITKINVPTLIVWGRQDKDTPIYMAKKLHKKIPKSGLIVFRKAGHFSYLDEFATFVKAIESFIGCE